MERGDADASVVRPFRGRWRHVRRGSFGWGRSHGSGAWMKDMWKRDSVYACLVLSGIISAPRAGVIRSRSFLKDSMSKVWLPWMSMESVAIEQSAAVMLLAMVTIDVQIALVCSSEMAPSVIIGKVASMILSDVVVASCHGA